MADVDSYLLIRFATLGKVESGVGMSIIISLTPRPYRMRRLGVVYI